MPYECLFSPKARKQVARLPRDVQDRATLLAAELATSPRGPGCLKLAGKADPVQYRLRVGDDCRLIYTVDDEQARVVVIWIGHRRDAYRRR